MKSSKEDQNANFDPAEAKIRFEAALKGARIAGHVPMKAQVKKAAEQNQTKKRRK